MVKYFLLDKKVYLNKNIESQFLNEKTIILHKYKLPKINDGKKWQNMYKTPK
jgi:hypothetical protein